MPETGERGIRGKQQKSGMKHAKAPS